MPALKTIGLFEKDYRLLYVCSGVYIVQNPSDESIRVFFKSGAKDKVARALKMSGVTTTSEPISIGEFYQQEARGINNEEGNNNNN